MEKFLVITQARMTSTRLPGKVLMHVGDGVKLLELHLLRLKKSKLIKDIVVATTVNEIDNEIIELCKKMEIKYFRGSELNVLERFHEASKLSDCEYIIRVTSDCPFIDPQVLDESIVQYLESGADYGSNSEDYPNGMNVEIFTKAMLNEAFSCAKENYEREHVTPYFYTNKDKFKLMQVRSVEKYPKYRLTVDTKEDLELIREIYKNLNENPIDFNLRDICNVISLKPNLVEINKHIRQKLFNE